MASRILSAAFLSYLLGLTSVIAKPTSFFGVHEITPRASYLGGWPLALDGLKGGCPSIASVQCDGGPYGSLNDQCCPSGNTCFTDILVAYCCPSANDCKTSVTNFPVCASPGMTMYATAGGNFCCQAGQKGINPVTGYDGLCVPADQGVSNSLLAKTVTQITAAASSASGSVGLPAPSVPPVSSAIASSAPVFTVSENLTSASSAGPVPTSGSTKATTTTTAPVATNTGNGENTTGTAARNSNRLGLGAIIGLAIGGVAVLLLAGILWMLIQKHREKQHQQNPVYTQAPLGPSDVPQMTSAAALRKPVAMTHSNSVYSNNTVSPVSPNPPQYSNLASQAPEHYNPRPPPAHEPFGGYTEVEGSGRQHENRAELR